jgi:LPS-assembly lipoprotein
MSFLRLSFFVSFMVVLTACGFHLRGQGPSVLLPSQLKVLFVESKQPYSVLTREVEQMLTGMGVKLVDNARAAPFTLSIIRAEASQQTTGMSPTTQISTYALSYTIIYQITDKEGRMVVPPRTITASRSYASNTNQMLSANYEYAQLENDMRRDVISQMTYQLGANDILQAVTAK